MRIVNRMMAAAVIACGAWTLQLNAQTAPAAQAGFQRIPLQRGDLARVANHEVVQAIAEVTPGAESGRHTHPGEEFGFVLSGTLLLEIEGQPAVTKKAGEAFIIPAGAVHNARNTGQAQSRILATYIIRKGDAVATPVQ